MRLLLTAKRRGPLLLFLAMLVFGSGSVLGQGIAILATRDAEVRKLRAALSSPVSSEQVAGRTVIRGELDGTPVWIAKTKPGLVNAAMTAQLLVDRGAPDLMVSLGLCAGLSDDISVGDLLIARTAVRHDLGTETDAGFLHGTSTRQSAPLVCPLLKKAPDLWASLTAPSGLGLRPVVLASGASFIRSRYKRQWIASKLDAEAVDMSAAALAHVARENGRDWMVVRQVSDHGDETAGKDFTSFAGGDVSALVEAVLRGCRAWIEEQHDVH